MKQGVMNICVWCIEIMLSSKSERTRRKSFSMPFLPTKIRSKVNNELGSVAEVVFCKKQGDIYTSEAHKNETAFY